MMSSTDLFYGESEPVWVAETSPYPVRRGHLSSYDSDRYYTRPGSAAGYYRESSYGRRGSDYYSGDRYSEYDGRYRSRPSYDYYEKDGYVADPYYSSVSRGVGYEDATYFDSKPNQYYDYRRPSTVTLWVPICCEACSEEARNAMFELRGVRSVYCDVERERVTVTGTAAPADILQAMRRLHKRTRLWGDEDFY